MGMEKSFQSSALEYLNNLPGCKEEMQTNQADQI